jgi:hypothetical protein
MPTMGNPLGKHRPKQRHPGEGTVVKRKDRWRAKPWAAVVPYTDASGRRRTTWLSAGSRAEAEGLLRDELKKRKAAPVVTGHTVGSYVKGWLMTADLSPRTFDRYRQHVEGRPRREAPGAGRVKRRVPRLTEKRIWGRRPRTYGVREIAALFGVPYWLVADYKRPSQHRIDGQRGRGHHRPHRG